MENTTSSVSEQTSEVETPVTSEILDNILKNLDNTIKSLKTHVTEIRNLKKDVQFMEKKLKRFENKKTKRAKSGDSGNKSKNGFAKPTAISNELAEFLKSELVDVLEADITIAEDDTTKVKKQKEKEKEENPTLLEKVNGLGGEDNYLARTEVTKLLNRYVKFHELQDPEKKKNILLDSEYGSKLKDLLSDIVDDEGNETDLTFINIQKYIKHHFPSKDEPAEPKVKAKVIKAEEEEEEEDAAVKKTVGIKKKIKRPLRKKQVAA